MPLPPATVIAVAYLTGIGSPGVAGGGRDGCHRITPRPAGAGHDVGGFPPSGVKAIRWGRPAAGTAGCAVLAAVRIGITEPSHETTLSTST